MSYKIATYATLSSRAKRLFDFLVDYGRQNGGKRASQREILAGVPGIHRDLLIELLNELTDAGLYSVKKADNNQRIPHRAYRLPGEQYTHPHTAAKQRGTFGAENRA